MAKLLTFFISFCLFGTLFSQNNVGIGILNPDPSALLDLSSTDKGLLVPRMTTSQMNAITTPYPSLLIYNTDSNCFAFRKGLEWKYICDVSDSLVSNIGRIDTLQSNLIRTDSLIIRGIGIDSLIQQKAWLLDGNHIQNGQFLGSENNEDLVFKTNAIERLRIDKNGYFRLYSQQPQSTAHPYRNGLLLESETDNSIGGRLGILSYANSEPPILWGYRARGSKSNPQSLLTGDDIFSIYSSGYNGSGFTSGPQSARIFFNASENWTNTANGTHISFFTVPNTTSIPALTLNLLENGRIVLPRAGTPDTGKVLTSIDNTGTAEWRTPTDNMPCGSVIMWAGALNAIPAGWYLCDGQNGTPDLRERFVMGASSSTDLYTRDGSNRKQLSIAESPNHMHNGTTSQDGKHRHKAYLMEDYRGSTGCGSNIDGEDPERYGNWGEEIEVRGTNTGGCPPSTTIGYNGEHSHSIYTTQSGGSQSFEIIPQYYKLAYIHKCTGTVPIITCNSTTTNVDVCFDADLIFSTENAYVVTNQSSTNPSGLTGRCGQVYNYEWVYYPYSSPTYVKKAYSSLSTKETASTNCILASGEWQRIRCRVNYTFAPKSSYWGGVGTSIKVEDVSMASQVMIDMMAFGGIWVIGGGSPSSSMIYSQNGSDYSIKNSVTTDCMYSGYTVTRIF